MLLVVYRHESSRMYFRKRLGPDTVSSTEIDGFKNVYEVPIVRVSPHMGPIAGCKSDLGHFSHSGTFYKYEFNAIGLKLKKNFLPHLWEHLKWFTAS